MQESKITRKKLAEKMETSPAAITKFLNGDTNFTLKTLIKFSLCLEKDLIFSFSAKRKKRFDPFEYFHSQKVTTITYGLMNDCSIWSSADSQKTPFPKNWNVNSADSIPCVGKCAV